MCKYVFDVHTSKAKGKTEGGTTVLHLRRINGRRRFVNIPLEDFYIDKPVP
jgi:hypothetical protein